MTQSDKVAAMLFHSRAALLFWIDHFQWVSCSGGLTLRQCTAEMHSVSLLRVAAIVLSICSRATAAQERGASAHACRTERAGNFKQEEFVTEDAQS